ncbi:MAG: NTP/NDP exchange transporter [Myxococcota bacterium]
MSNGEVPRAGDSRRSPLERFLSLFADVERGEGVNVLLMFANIFLILTAYYVLKVVREGLTIGGIQLFGLGGDEIKAYLPALMTLLLLGVVPAYGALASRVSRIRLINATTLLVIGTLVCFWLWGSAVGVGTTIGLSFYVYLGIINVFLIAQFWSFANDIYSESQGKRLFAIIAIGQSLGAVLGPRLAAVGSGRIFLLLAVSAGLFGLCLVLYNWINAREASRARETGEGADVVGDPLRKGGGFQLVLRTRYLLLIASMILVTNVVNTTGEYILSNAAKTHAAEQVPALTPEQVRAAGEAAQALLERGEAANLADAREAAEQKALRGARSEVIGEFYASFFFWVNLVGVFTQMFLVSRVFKYFGVRAALFVLPVIAFGGYAAIALIGGLGVLRIAKTAENSTDYSLQNTVKQALFLPTSREAKYKAKAAIDTFFVRFGDTAAAAVVFVGLHVLHFVPRSFALVNVGLVAVWIALNIGIAREHKKMVPHDRGAHV